MTDEDKSFFWAICLGIVLFIAFIFGLSAFGLIFNRSAAPYAEETRAMTYDKSRTYNQGMAVDLDDLCRQRRLATDDATRVILADTIRLRSARYMGELPAHVQSCVEEVR